MPHSALIEQAIELASQWHDGTYRKSRWREAAFELDSEPALQVPVISHLAAVANIVARAGWDEATIAAAYLHDILEDRNKERGMFSYDRLVALMGKDVADLVRAVSEDKHDAEGQPLPWRVRKEGYIERLQQHGPAASAISLADKLHNVWTMNQALEKGIDIFSSDEGRRKLTAGPDEQRWYYKTILDVTDHPDEPRITAIRIPLLSEVERFVQLTGTLESR